MKNNDFLINLINEALKDEIPDYQKDVVRDKWGDKYLDMDVPKHTKNIPNIKIKLEKDTLYNKLIKELIKNFKQTVFNNLFKSKIFFLNQRFLTILSASLGFDIHLVAAKQDFKTFKAFYGKNYRMLETKNNDIDNPKFTNNTTSLSKFIISYNHAFPNEAVQYDFSADKSIQGLRNIIENFNDNIKNIKHSDLYLYISDKPSDKLTMSVSKFYDSCQNLYNKLETEHVKRLLSNVFDKNSKVAYLIYNTPFKDKIGNVIPYTSICRAVIRNIRGKIHIDTVYPEIFADEFHEVLKKYAGLETNYEGKDYPVKGVEGLHTPYMDNLNARRKGVPEPESVYKIAVSKVTGISVDDLEETQREKNIIRNKRKPRQEFLVCTHEDAMHHAEFKYVEMYYDIDGDNSADWVKSRLAQKDALNILGKFLGKYEDLLVFSNQISKGSK